MEADDRKAAELAMIENLQREDLNPIEEAAGYQTLIDEYGLTQEEVSKRVGKSRSAVTNALRLLSLPDAVHLLLEEGRLSAGHARAILSCPVKELQKKLAQKVVNDGLSVRQTEALAKRLAKSEEALDEAPAAPARPPSAWTGVPSSALRWTHCPAVCTRCWTRRSWRWTMWTGWSAIRPTAASSTTV